MFVILSVLDIASLKFVSVQNIIPILLFALFTAGFTAFVEELIFRGYVVKILKEYLSWRWIVLIICVLFTLYHLPQWGLPLPYWIRYFIMTVVFTLPFIVTKSLWLSIGIHFGGNFTYYMLLTELGFLATEKNDYIIETMGWVSLGFAFVLLCFIYVFLQKVKHYVHK